jgi:hypothetical protein
MDSSKVSRVAQKSAKLVVLYGPQAKIMWDKGGRQVVTAATKQARTVNLRRKAFAHAGGLIDGSVLKIAPTGTTMYVVFSGDQPLAAYPQQQLPYAVLLEHADLSKRAPAVAKPPRARRVSVTKTLARIVPDRHTGKES